VSNTKLLSREETKYEKIFKNEYRRTDQGKFEMALPFWEDPSVLGDSEASALKRLQNGASLSKKSRITRIIRQIHG